ncbi:hypothetical protein [Tropicibacter sp. Alg240-R139]|uniref:hypothetical protein n=1 Tax=Tropicibacter sp. Alg240-R139 TaxID=2305991 RepID=UPI0013E001C1|nr:hypothetical protein [Tropicibacter sp. Alg240-R139]
MNTNGPTRADETICYGFYTASHAVSRAYAPYLKRLGLTYPQYLTLTLLWDTDRQMVNAPAKAQRRTITGCMIKQTGMTQPELQDWQCLLFRLRDGLLGS